MSSILVMQLQARGHRVKTGARDLALSQVEVQPSKNISSNFIQYNDKPEQSRTLISRYLNVKLPLLC